jgi:hypothetical protein
MGPPVISSSHLQPIPFPSSVLQLPRPPTDLPAFPAPSRLSYGHPWAHYLGGYQDRLLGGPPGLPDLSYTTPDGVEGKDCGGGVLG